MQREPIKLIFHFVFHRIVSRPNLIRGRLSLFLMGPSKGQTHAPIQSVLMYWQKGGSNLIHAKPLPETLLLMNKIIMDYIN